jgi:branched-chain amino acid transport system ATP-binding protein
VEQSVATNLELGCYGSGLGRNEIEARLERTMDLFPVLRERASQRTSTMSGGEQQMVAIGRALMSQPRLLILDEPSMGLAPKITGEVFDALARLRADGLSILLVEQNAPLAFELADRGYLMRQGEVVVSGSIEELEQHDVVRSAYLGA